MASKSAKQHKPEPSPNRNDRGQFVAPKPLAPAKPAKPAPGPVKGKTGR